MAEGERDARAVWFVGTALVLIAAAFALYGTRLNHAIDLANQNTERIEAQAWLTCNDVNASFSRQNAVIDQAIGAEQRKAHPDPRTLDGLRNFKLRLHECGARPAGVPAGPP